MEKSSTILRWRQDPVLFVRECVGADPTEQQLELLSAVGQMARDKVLSGQYSAKRGISVMSGRGVGKDATVAWIMLWALVCLPDVRIPCTAPVADQLRNVLWAEFSKWLKQSKVSDMFEIQTDKIYLKTGDREEGKTQFAVARTAMKGENAKETLSGMHSDYLIFICDEASGIEDRVFDPLEGGLTGICNFIVMIFNPTRASGYAYKTHFGINKDQWVRFRWNAEESRLVSKEHIASIKEKYGQHSNKYRVDILGLPPSSDVDSLIPIEWVEDAIDRHRKNMLDVENDPIFFGVDCAGFGADKSVILVRQGNRVLELLTYTQKSTTDLAGWVLHHMGEYEPKGVAIDVGGLGAGVYDQVKNFSHGAVLGVNVSRRASNPEKYDRLRDELWWRVRQKFENSTIEIPEHEDLRNELSSLRYQARPNGAIKVESKREMRSRGLDSPDSADSLQLSYAFSDNYGRKPIRDYDEDDNDFYEGKRNRIWKPKRRGWMYA